MQAEELYREVDEEMQREKLLLLWRRYGRLVLALIVLLVLVVGGYFGWRAYQDRLARQDALAYAAAQAQLQAGDAKGAAEAFARIAGSNASGYGPLATLREAQTKLDANDRPGAIALLDRLAADAHADAVFRAIATLSSVSLQIDSGDPQALHGRLQPLVDDGGPWRFNARGMQGVLALRQNDDAGALKIFGALADDADAPRSLQNQAAELRDALNARRPPAAGGRAGQPTQ